MTKAIGLAVLIGAAVGIGVAAAAKARRDDGRHVGHAPDVHEHDESDGRP